MTTVRWTQKTASSSSFHSSKEGFYKLSLNYKCFSDIKEMYRLSKLMVNRNLLKTISNTDTIDHFLLLHFLQVACLQDVTL